MLLGQNMVYMAQKPIFVEKSKKLSCVEGFLHGLVELHETQIFFSQPK